MFFSKLTYNIILFYFTSEKNRRKGHELIPNQVEIQESALKAYSCNNIFSFAYNFAEQGGNCFKEIL